MKKSLKFTIVMAGLLLACEWVMAQNETKRNKNHSITLFPVEVAYPKDMHQMTLFPNPAAEQVKICFEGMQREGFRIELYDSSGNKVLAREWKGEELDISSFDEGVYVLYLRRNKESFSRKLLIKR